MLPPGPLVQTVPDHVDDAEMNLRVWEYRLNHFRKTFENIDSGDEDILHSTVFSSFTT
jgi:hypothetical protein